MNDEMKIRSGFLRTQEGRWYNIKNIIDIFVVQHECFKIAFTTYRDHHFNHQILESDFNTVLEAQIKLDALMDFLDYENPETRK